MRERSRAISSHKGQPAELIDFREVGVDDVFWSLYQIAAQYLLGRKFTPQELKTLREKAEDKYNLFKTKTPIPLSVKIGETTNVHRLGPTNGKVVQIFSITVPGNPLIGSAQVLLEVE